MAKNLNKYKVMLAGSIFENDDDVIVEASGFAVDDGAVIFWIADGDSANPMTPAVRTEAYFDVISVKRIEEAEVIPFKSIEANDNDEGNDSPEPDDVA